MSLADPYPMLQDVCDREFGFQPLNFSIKPVHVANGLARALTQRSYKTDALARTLRRYVIKQTLGVEQERHPNTEILEKYADAFEPLRGTAPDPQRLSRLRHWPSTSSAPTAPSSIRRTSPLTPSPTSAS